jgi:protocatechuate 3,4-dioxygenase beta subunit
LAGQNVHDVEGLSFFNDGQLYGSTGNNGPSLSDRNKLVRIDKVTGVTTILGAFPAGLQDYEAVACLTADVHISLKKYTNGPGQLPQDADTLTGPQIAVGAPVTWTYVITNTGLLTLTNLILTDDKVGLVGPGGLSNCPPANTILGPGDSIHCTATGVAQAGQYANLGNVTGSTPAGLINPDKTVSANDPSHYFGITTPQPGPQPGLAIEKLTNGQPADGANDLDVPVITPSAPVTWTYRVTNIGNVSFAESEVKVTDDLLGAITQIVDKGDGDATLAPGESWIYQKVGTALNLAQTQSGITIVPGCDPNHTGQTHPTYENIGTVTVGSTTASDPSHYCNPVVNPPAGNLGDYVWHDRNNNGIQDEAADQGVPNVQVKLFTSAGQEVAATTTNANGYYLFSNVQTGQYYIEFALPSGFDGFSPANQGNDKEKDSDVVTLNQAIGRTNPFPFTADGTSDLSWDAGIYQRAGVGDFVWLDENNDGIQQPAEQSTKGLGNVVVELYQVNTASQNADEIHANSTLLQRMTTNDKGLYQFTKLAPGRYYLHFALPTQRQGEQMALVEANQGNDDHLDSDVSGTGETIVFTLQSGQYDDTWDAGIAPVSTKPPTALDEENEPTKVNQVFLPVVQR